MIADIAAFETRRSLASGRSRESGEKSDVIYLAAVAG